MGRKELLQGHITRSLHDIGALGGGRAPRSLLGDPEGHIRWGGVCEFVQVEPEDRGQAATLGNTAHQQVLREGRAELLSAFNHLGGPQLLCQLRYLHL